MPKGRAVRKVTASAARRLRLICFKGAGIAVSVGLPVWAILEKFPAWHSQAGVAGTLGIGGAMAATVALVTFKRTVFDYVKEKTGIKHAPPLAIWCALLALSFALSAAASLLSDMRSVFISGAVGSGIGTVLNFIGESASKDKADRAEKERNADEQDR